jgi:hypothetical protein
MSLFFNKNSAKQTIQPPTHTGWVNTTKIYMEEMMVKFAALEKEKNESMIRIAALEQDKTLGLLH